MPTLSFSLLRDLARLLRLSFSGKNDVPHPDAEWRNSAHPRLDPAVLDITNYCKLTLRQYDKGDEQAQKSRLRFLSEPSGARIEVNDNYIGDTPITTTLRCSPDGRFIENTTIRALPTQPGDYVQSKLFYGGYSSNNSFGSYSDNTLDNTIPSRVFFDMRLGPVGRDINVNIQ